MNFIIMIMLRYFLLIGLIVSLFACSESSLDKHDIAVPSVDQTIRANRIQVTLNFLPPPSIKQLAAGRLTPVSLGLPTNVLHAVGDVRFTNDANPVGFTLGKTIVTWTGIDQAGNTRRATQLVIISSESCLAYEPNFQQIVWPILSNACLSCHNQSSSTTSLNFSYDISNGKVAANFQVFKNSAAKTDITGNSLLLSKTANTHGDHVGGTIFSMGDTKYNSLANLVQQLEVCYEENLAMNNLILADPYKRWRKTTLALAGRLPTAVEEVALNSASDNVQLEVIVDKLLDGLLDEPAFYTHLKEFYNDLLLTDAFIGDNKALTLRFDNYANSRYFDDSALSQNGYDMDDTRTLRRHVNFGLSQAPLELIAYVVKHNLPFTQILTADYVMVNAYSAALFDAQVVDDSSFNFRYDDNYQQIDPTVFKPAVTVDRHGRTIPHAGVLTTLAFLSRYSSTRISRNRKRARYVFLYFLDIDIEGLADRSALDLTSQIGLFPPLQDPQCKVCHDVMDPVAGLFKNWDDFGRFRGDFNVWPNVRTPPEMLPPGYNFATNDLLPAEYNDTALQWLAKKITDDNRFALATVHMIYMRITGQHPGSDTVFFDQLKQQFVNSNYNLKGLIRSVINSFHFRAENAVTEIGDANPLQQEYGMGRLLSPEQLHRKIMAITGGYDWRSPTGKNLLDVKNNRLIYGGIDSDSVTQRNPNPNGLTAGLQSRIALQLSCEIVPIEFSLPTNQRVLLPFVEITDVPDNRVRQSRIVENIRYLFKQVWGETLSLSELEVEKVLALFIAVRDKIAATGISRDCYGLLTVDDPIVVDEMKTVRPWMAVLAYFFLDYRFFFE